MAKDEHSGINSTSQKISEDLAKGNKLYYEKFGYIFIVCATGKEAKEMLRLLDERLLNNPSSEIKIAMSEQNKITNLRLEKLFL